MPSSAVDHCRLVNIAVPGPAAAALMACGHTLSAGVFVEEIKYLLVLATPGKRDDIAVLWHHALNFDAHVAPS